MSKLPPPLGGAEPSPWLTLRVYRVTDDGRVTADTGTVNVEPSPQPLLTSAWPPCRCPRHRGES
ncbi:hypothetical protein C1I97_06040 [Streptomyces sp. NTH33]|nr:hypothetical protein C1I97_06040 [Streptomyces sp. NTH33]